MSDRRAGGISPQITISYFFTFLTKISTPHHEGHTTPQRAGKSLMVLVMVMMMTMTVTVKTSRSMSLTMWMVTLKTMAS